MNILLDTNILLRLLSPKDEHYAAVKHAIKFHGKTARFIWVPQTLNEFWAAMTRPLASNGLGLSHTDGMANILDMGKLCQFLPDPVSITEVWLDLMNEYGILGRESFDTKLVAAMQCHGIQVLMTINEKDFKKYPFIEVINPARSV